MQNSIKLFTNSLTGFSSFFQGLAFIARHSLWGYILFPSLISLFVGASLVYYIQSVLSAWALAFLTSVFQAESGVFSFFVHLFALFVGIFVVIIFYRTLVSLFILPFMGPLLEKVERILLGRSITISLFRDLRNGIYGAWVGLKFTVIALVVFVLTLPLGPFQFFLVAPLEGYFLGRGSLDYILEKESRDLEERKRKTRELTGETLGLGLAFFLFLLIPIVGVLLAPAAGVVGAALIRYGKES